MPVIDSTYMETPFLEDDPATMLSNGDFPSDIDVMIGATKDEGIIYLTGGTYTAQVLKLFNSDCFLSLIRFTWW